ncbi:MAG: class I SAM-dependent methyltransferase [Kiritimatiellia bacterium]
MKSDSKKTTKNRRSGAVEAAPSGEKRLTYAETLLLEAVPTAVARGGRLLVAGNRSGVVVAEAMRAGGEVFAHAFDVHHARAICDHLVESRHPTEGVFCTPGVRPSPEAPAYDAALFMTTPRSMPAELVLDQLQDIYQNLAEGGSLFAAFEGDPDAALKTMKLVWPAVHVVKKAKYAILFRAVKKGELKKVRSFAADWQASVPGGEKLTFSSLPGCFCHRRADDGGLALAEVAAREIENLRVDPANGLRLLDMGCGCGLVGLLVADAWRRRAAALPLHLTLVDSHARAIEATRVNAERAGIPVDLILADDGLPRGRSGEFDLYVGNPPYYSDYRIAEIFLETAYRALRPGGVCLSVVKTATGLLSLQETYFKTAEVIKRRGYCVLRSVRE